MTDKKTEPSSSAPKTEPVHREEAPRWLVELRQSVQSGQNRFGARVSQ